MCAPLRRIEKISMRHFRKRCAMAHMAHARIIPVALSTPLEIELDLPSNYLQQFIVFTIVSYVYLLVSAELSGTPGQ